LNTYFKKRRSKAIGFTVTVTGFGPIVLPQLITFLMKFYDPQGVMLIFGGLCAHFFVTALLLQPVKWHMKDENEQLTLEQKKSNGGEVGVKWCAALNQCLLTVSEPLTLVLYKKP
jgi:MFS family permease